MYAEGVEGPGSLDSSEQSTYGPWRVTLIEALDLDFFFNARQK
jgi:hypothetical protein